MNLHITSPFYKTLFFIFTFVFLSNSVIAKANAPQSCGGVNILDEIKQNNPEQYKFILDEAAKVTNQDGLLWRVEKEGLPTSYLFGTMHTTDPRVTRLSYEVFEAIAQSQTIAVEIANMDPSGLPRLMQKNPAQFMLLGKEKLDTLLSAKDYAVIAGVAKAAGMSPKIVKSFKPWLASISFFSIPLCEALRVASGLKVLDDQVKNLASSQGKKVVSLETMSSQFAAMASIEQEHAVTMLVNSIDNHKRMNDIYSTTVHLYDQRQIGKIWALSLALARDGEKTKSAMQAFSDILIVKRNKEMFEKSQKLSEAGSTFVAVGALHLVGEYGLVELYRRAGYKVTKIN